MKRNNLKNREIKLGDLLFYVAYFLFIFSIIFFEYSELKYFQVTKSFYKLFELIIYSLFILKIFLEKSYKFSEIIKIIILSICFLLSYFFSENSVLIKALLIIIAAKGVKFKNIVKFDMKIKFIFIFLIIGLSITGVINNYILIRNNTNQLRYSFGFIHPNIFSSFFLILCIEYVYLRYYKIKKIEYLIIITIMFFVNLITDSRTCMYIIILLIILCVYFKNFSNKFEKNKMLKNVIIYLTTICSIISLILSINFNIYNNNYININNLFSGRIQQANKFINEYGISLFGQKVQITSYRDALNKGIKAAILDNAYINIFTIYGIITLLIFCYGFAILSKKIIKDKKYNFLICIIAFSFYGLMETYLFKITFNVFLLYISTILYVDE